ncbi:Tex family protein [Desulfoplanes sp. PS50]
MVKVEERFLILAREMGVDKDRIAKVAALLDQGATVPFIARYRKEMTGSLDEVAISGIRDGLERLTQLDQRREAVLGSLRERDLLTDALQKKIAHAETLSVLEDIYLPYRPKRRTKATMAREKGLAPLAVLLARQEPGNVEDLARPFVNPEKGVADISQALEGAGYILAEEISEDRQLRGRMRIFFAGHAVCVSQVKKGKETDGIKFKDYFEWSEKASKAPSHRLLAMFRGERETILNVHVLPDEAQAMQMVVSHVVKNRTPSAEAMESAGRDAYKRLLAPSMETELRGELKKRADREAISVFAENLRELLMAPPLGQKRVMGLDPGFRTGAKLVCLDEQGGLVHYETIFPTLGETQRVQAAERVRVLCARYRIQAVAIGNGTAGRETESFVRSLHLGDDVDVVLVNESGASVYSASEVAREEFPHHDVTVRGAVSIGRRLMDPLAELVKIDPKAIGVGQYQHDVDQAELKKSLEEVVVSCVNQVGVEVNTASRDLLTYVSGLGPTLAGNIVAHREEHGPFTTRKELLKVARLGPKAFEQAAGFLRIRGGRHPLDGSAVHPESYVIVEKIAGDLGCTVRDLMDNPGLQKKVRIENYVSEMVGLPTLRDIMDELTKPGRDPRAGFRPFAFADHVATIQDLEPGMRLPGIVTNVTRFGAFVDVGVHQDGLVHISQLADRYVKDPSEIVKVGQQVEVMVLDVDVARKRISLSMKAAG